MSYPCNECGTVNKWSIFSDDVEEVSFEVCKTFPSNSFIDGCYIIESQPSARKNYEVVIRARVNGSGETVYMEKLK